MAYKVLSPRKSLNKAFLKARPVRSEIELFKSNLLQTLDRIKPGESEEFHKTFVSDFLKNTYYNPRYFINPKGRTDLVIHNGPDSSNSAGVILEVKSPTNKAEMVRIDNINAKAFQELVWYFMQEKISLKNLEVKYLIATNITEWFVFDAAHFEKWFTSNKAFVKQFLDFKEKRLSGKGTDFFYEEIASPAISAIQDEICFTHFDIRDYDVPLRNIDKSDDKKLIALFKLLSPEHLLKLPFSNDSNKLDKGFYTELLHIIGLEESKDGSKKIIGRKQKEARNSGSLLENSIIQLESLDKISRLEHPHRFGSNQGERTYAVALELCITWINRILFLKLLEAQLIKYHKEDTAYAFLNLEKVKTFDDLNSLFFSVLAKNHGERSSDVERIFKKVPYLNSSLFEPSEIEHIGIFISQLSDDKKIPIISTSALRDKNGKRVSGKIGPLEYLFSFLNAFDFSSEGSEDVQEDNKTLISASVLGLIFEKINGYKDGSFFTPGYITMYMCKESIRHAVIDKFNEAKNWQCTDFVQLYNSIGKIDVREANNIMALQSFVWT